ncbi:MAG: transketolase [bacterium]|nr:transketolase [bacterium]
MPRETTRYKTKKTKKTEVLSELAKLVRYYIIQSTTKAGSGHPTSSLSAVELMVALMFSGMFRADLAKPDYHNNDRLIFSKGHASPLLYSLYAVAGKVSEKELYSLRKFGSRLEGHPMPVFRYTEAPTGSLGQGLSIGLGEAISAKMDALTFRTYVLLGDSEMAEGSVWEAMQLAAYYKIDNLVAIIDVNRLGQTNPTMLEYDVREYATRARSFGWKTFVVDGHKPEQILKAYEAARQTKGQPAMIVAKTVKGKGAEFSENKNGWHGKAFTAEQAREALASIGPVDRRLRGTVAPPADRQLKETKSAVVKPPQYAKSVPQATRKGFGNALARLGPAYPRMTVLDAEVQNSTYTNQFAEVFSQRFIQAYIAEQNMVGLGVGLSLRGKIPVIASFGAFLSRAHDQIRMAQYADTHLIFVGTHAGVHIGEDGASQMALEDIAMFRSLHNSSVLCPADAMSMEKLFELALTSRGLVYMRATRGETPILYGPKDEFRIGGSYVLRSSDHDFATIVGAGVTVHEALRAAEGLAKRGKMIRVIDLYSIKPIDSVTLRKAAKETGRIVVVEDHRPEGGIAEAVRTALGREAGVVTSLSVNKLPRSGKPEQLLKHQGIDAASIISAITNKR